MLNNPFIPKAEARVVIVHGKADGEIINNLENLGLIVVKTIGCKDVADPISYHPDIVFHPLTSNTLVVAPNVYDYYKDIFRDLNINLIKGDYYLSNKYPRDIAYNIGRMNNLAIHNFEYTDSKILKEFNRSKIGRLDVTQGYSKCSLMLVDENTGITSDRLMYEKLVKNGKDMLLISPGYIKLPGYNYGFIGGATGNLSNKEILFSGNLRKHPDRLKIERFLDDRNKKCIFLSNKDIIDLGTIMVLT